MGRIQNIKRSQNRRKVIHFAKLISIVVIGIFIFSYLYTSFLNYETGDTVVGVIDNKWLDANETRYKQMLSSIETDSLNLEQISIIDGLNSIFSGFKGTFVNDSMKTEILIRIDLLKEFPKK